MCRRTGSESKAVAKPIGGVLGAPLGAWAARHFPVKWMLILVGIVLTLTSAYGVYSAIAG